LCKQTPAGLLSGVCFNFTADTLIASLSVQALHRIYGREAVNLKHIQTNEPPVTSVHESNLPTILVTDQGDTCLDENAGVATTQSASTGREALCIGADTSPTCRYASVHESARLLPEIPEASFTQQRLAALNQRIVCCLELL
jgi:hypothetical protein